MTFEEIREIVTAAVASVGGVAGIVAIVTSLAKIIAAAKSGKTVTKYTSAVNDMKQSLLEEMQTALNCSLDVDISAKLNEVLETLEAQYVQKAQEIDEKLEVMRALNVEMTRLMSTSRKITEDKRKELNALIEKADSLVTAADVEVKPKLLVKLQSAAQTTTAAQTTEAGAVSVKQHKITI